METKTEIIDYLIGCNLPETDVRIVSAMIEMLIIKVKMETIEKQNKKTLELIDSIGK